MKKIAIVVAIVGASIIGVGSGIVIYNTTKDKTKPVVSQTSGNAKVALAKKEVKAGTNKDDTFDIFKESKSINAVIAGNIDVTMLPNTIQKTSDGFTLNEYYNQYSNQIMNLNVKTSDDTNTFVMDESQNGQATGIYKLNFNSNKTQATGTFENVSTGKISSVTMNFGGDVQSNNSNNSNNNSDNSNNNSNNNSDNNSSSNTTENSQSASGSTVKRIVTKFMGLQVGGENAETLNSLYINGIQVMAGCAAMNTTQQMFNPETIIKPEELIKGVYGYAISAGMYNPKSRAYVYLDTNGNQITWTRVIESYEDGTLIRYPDGSLVASSNYGIDSVKALNDMFNNGGNLPHIASYGLESINFYNQQQ